MVEFLGDLHKTNRKNILDMTQEDKELIRKFCKDNLDTHTDWTGTYVETVYKCESVNDFINQLFNYIEEHERRRERSV